MSTGIVGYGVYIPRCRIKREEIAKVWGGGAPGIKEKSVADVDEDSTTMAVEAAQGALKHTGIDPSQIGVLYVASVSSPYVNASMAAIIAEVLIVPPDAPTADFGGSTRASTAALQACIDFVDSGRASYGMVIGSDFLVGEPGDLLEHSLGAGAGAYIIGRDNIIAEIEGLYSHRSTYINTWRCDGDHFMRRHDDPRLERSFGYPKHIAEAGKGLMKKLGRKGEEFSQAALHQPDGQSPSIPAKSLGLKPEAMSQSSIAQYIGDTGCSSVLIGLASILDYAKPGERILGISYGSGGGSDAFSIMVVDGIDKKRSNVTPVKHFLEEKDYIDYPKYEKAVGILKGVGGLPEPMSSWVAQPGWEREKEYLLQLKALKCKKCGSLNFPKRHYCLDCRGEEFEEVPLPRRGKILSFNIQYVVAVAPEESPIPVCTAKMGEGVGEYGGNISAMMTETKAEDVKIGMPAELIFRRCGQELGLPRYGYKFRLVKE